MAQNGGAPHQGWWLGTAWPPGLVALFLAIVSYNNLTSLFPREIHDLFYVPVNLFVLAVSLIWALRRHHFSSAALGLAGSPWKSLSLGTALGVLLPAPVFVLSAYPDLMGETVEDPRVAASTAELLFIVLVRIPFATALFEEVLFRGILLAQFREVTTDGRAALLSSVAFGLWHTSVTVRNFRDSGAFDNPALMSLAVVGVIIATFMGGLLFTWMRYHTGHLAGSTVAHWLVNSLSSVALYIRTQQLA